MSLLTFYKALITSLFSFIFLRNFFSAKMSFATSSVTYCASHTYGIQCISILSIPLFSVMCEDGQALHAPYNNKNTVPSSMSMYRTLPPSARSIGRIRVANNSFTASTTSSSPSSGSVSSL